MAENINVPINFGSGLIVETPKTIKATKTEKVKNGNGQEVDIGEPDKYELFFRRPEVIGLLLGLETDNFQMNGKKVLKAPAQEILYIGGELQGAAHGLNRVFTASEVAGEGLRMPFYARVRGGLMHIGRIGDKFDVNKYRATGYQRPHKGEPERVKEWLESLAKAGITFEVKGSDKWKPKTPEEVVALVAKIPSDIVKDTNEKLTKARESYVKALKEREAAIAEQQKAEAEAKAEAEKAAQASAQGTPQNEPVTPQTPTDEAVKGAGEGIKGTDGTETPEQIAERQANMVQG